MLCRRCMSVMRTGTTYEQKKGGGLLARRYYECKKCHDKAYVREPNFQEYMSKASEKCRNR